MPPPPCRFHPGYLTAERLARAKTLKLAVTADIGSDHVDLDGANKTNGGITVAEVTNTPESQNLPSRDLEQKITNVSVS